MSCLQEMCGTCAALWGKHEAKFSNSLHTGALDKVVTHPVEAFAWHPRTTIRRMRGQD